MSTPITPIKTCGTCGRVFATEADLQRETSRWRVCNRGNLWFNCKCNSTLLIPKGKFAWYDPAKMMGHKASSLFNTLAQRDNIPRLPTVIVEVQALLNAPDGDPARIAAAIRRDPLLAARVLGMANDLKLATGEKISSVEHAVVYLGRQAVAEVVQVAGMHSMSVGPPGFSRRFWGDSMMTGAIASFLAGQILQDHSPDQAWVAASLCNIGKLIAFVADPAATTDVLARTEGPSAISWTRAERRAGGKIDHMTLGEIGASLWGLPPYVVDACTQHHALPLIGTGRAKLVLPELVALSNQLTRWVNDELALIEMPVLTGYLSMAGRKIADMDPLKARAVEWRQKFASLSER